MLYNIYYSNIFTENFDSPFIQETKEFKNIQEATTYAAKRCIDYRFEWESRYVYLEDYINTAHQNPYFIEKGIDSKLMDAIGRKQYCMDITSDMCFYAVPVEDDELISEAFKNGTL